MVVNISEKVAALNVIDSKHVHQGTLKQVPSVVMEMMQTPAALDWPAESKWVKPNQHVCMKKVW